MSVRVPFSWPAKGGLVRPPGQAGQWDGGSQGECTHARTCLSALAGQRTLTVAWPSAALPMVYGAGVCVRSREAASAGGG